MIIPSVNALQSYGERVLGSEFTVDGLHLKVSLPMAIHLLQLCPFAISTSDRSKAAHLFSYM
jgi:hypothetical protein